MRFEVRTTQFAVALCFIFNGWLIAASVTPAVMQTVAANWLAEKTGAPVATTDLSPVSTVDLSGLEAFNRRSGGWVLVASDDLSRPVLAWSPTGAWGRDATPENCRAWLAAVSQSIVNAQPVRDTNTIVNGLWETYSQPTASFQTELASATRGTGSPPVAPTVGPLLTTSWGQNLYYNAQCPVDAAGPDGHAVAGCISVCMAQVMRYYQYPPQGVGSHTYTHPTYGELAANYGTAIYDWASMPGTGSLTVHNSAVAELIAHCGIAVEMDYGPSGSSASVSDAIISLKNYFRYHPDIRLEQKPDFSDAEWDALLQVEIDAGRPVIYDGPGHAFICDGYDASTPALYHFNWGWNGVYDGYYALSALTPGSNDFTSEQNATLGIKPEGDVDIGPVYSQSFEGAGIPENWFVDGEYVLVGSENATEGTQSLRIGASADVGAEQTGVYVRLAVPGAGGALTFDYYPEASGASSFDTYTCQIREQYGEGVLDTVFTGTAVDDAWHSAVVDLNSYAGQTITLYFDVTDITVGGYSWMYVDNFQFLDTPIADFAPERSTWFADMPLTFNNRSAGAASYVWTFAGGTPATSTDEAPAITFTAPGVYDVTLTASNANGDDTKAVSDCVVILPQPTLPYSNGFETDNGGFFAYSLEGDGTYEWQWGACSSDNFNGSYAAVTGSKSWATMLATDHGTHRQYALESPSFSFAETGDYTLSFKYRGAIGTNAGFNLETSTDGGTTWSVLGSVGDALASNWYTEIVPGLGDEPGWRQLSLAVFTPSYDISSFAGQGDVRFRFVFGALSNYSDGVQIDDFAIDFTAAPDPTYSLTVTSGTGSGTYAPGTVVPVAAAAPAPGYEFAAWTGDTAHLADPAAPETTYTMPNADSAITATYKLIIFRVRADAAPGGDGSSWATAMNDPQEAIEASSTAGGGQVWIGAGTYTPQSWPNGGTEEREKHFSLRNNVAVYGGFNGTETSLNQRDIKANPTILSGDIGVAGAPTDNCFSVLFHPSAKNLNETAILDGVRVKGGYADTHDNLAPWKDSGGGMYSQDSSPLMRQCVFSHNEANEGGAVYVDGGSSQLEDCLFESNTASSGGGVLFNNGSLSILRSTFRFNEANTGGAVYASEVFPDERELSLVNCTFDTNHAQNGSALSSHALTKMVHCTVFRGYVLQPGFTDYAVHITNAESEVVNCIISDILAADPISSGPSYPITQATIRNCVIPGGYDSGTDIIDADPLAQPSYGHGGMTPTSAISPNSPALDAGSLVLPAGIDASTDQRGTPRDAAPDIGAFEGAVGTPLGEALPDTLDFGTAGAGAGGKILETRLRMANVETFSLPDGFEICFGPFGWQSGLVTVPPYSWAKPVHDRTVQIRFTPETTGVYDEDVVIGGESVLRLQGMAVEADIQYVKWDATGYGDGSSWENAFTNLQPAIEAGTPYLSAVWIAQGTYCPARLADGSYGNQNSHYSLRNGVPVYGGFAGTETLLSQRNPAEHETILTADPGTPRNTSDNCYRVFYNAETDAITPEAWLDGMTIQNAISTGMVNRNATPFVSNCIFKGNTGFNGGAVHQDGGESPQFDACTFMNNQAENGGAVYMENGGAVFTNCTFYRNEASSSGAALCSDQGFILLNCTLSGNGGEAVETVRFTLEYATWFFTNSIFWNDTVSEILYHEDPPSYRWGKYIITDYCIIRGGFVNGANIINQDPLLQPVFNQGGSTPTAGLLLGSPALEAGNLLYSELAGNVDQRGFVRDATPDIGAFEGLGTTEPGGGFHPNTIDFGQVVSGRPSTTALVNLSFVNTDTLPLPSGLQYRPTGQLIWLDGPVRVLLNAHNYWEGSIEFRWVPQAVGPFSDALTLGNSTLTVAGEGIPGDVIYVRHDATGSNDGSSWENAFTNLQPAIDAGTAFVSEVWVASGTYYPDSWPNGGTIDRDMHFSLRNGIAVFGGFNGSEISRDQRNIKLNLTILSGDIGAPGDMSDNCYHVFYHASGTNLNDSAYLDGFTITAGNANGDSTEHKGGGGIYNYGSGNVKSGPTTSNCIISGNSASNYGAGVYSYYYSNPTFIDTWFVGNRSEGNGGACTQNYYSSATFVGCTFSENQAIYGAAVSGLDPSFSSFHHTISFLNCTFFGNIGRASSSRGGVVDDQTGTVTVAFCTFGYNDCDNGVLVGGLGTSIDLSHCVFASPGCIPTYIYSGGTINVANSVVPGGYSSGTGIVNADPLLLPLRDNGGPTATCGLSPGSPALNAGSPGPDSPLVDQRGFLRDSNPDFGAFEGIPSYTLSYIAGENGSIAGTSPQTVFHGENGTAVEAVPAEGYHFVQWSDGDTDRTRTDTDVTADVTVTAEFAINTYAVTFKPGSHGSLAGGTPNVTHTVDHGSPCPAPPTVTPNAEYLFTGWDRELSATITADFTTTAQYELKTYTLTVNNGTGSGTYPMGAVVPVACAAPAPGFEFDTWTGDTAYLAAPAASPTTFTMPNTPAAITATYKLRTYQVTFDLAGHATRTGGGQLSQSVEHGSSAVAPEFDVDAGWTFTGWNTVFDTITGPLTVTAQYEHISYTLTYTAGDHGAVEGVSPQTVFHGDDGAPVEAGPAEGYHFVQWSDGNTDRARTDTDVTADIDVTAQFAINSHTVTFKAGAHGALEGGMPDVDHTVDYGSPCPAAPAVTPAEGYDFNGWDPALPATVTADFTTTAQYELKNYALTVNSGTGSGTYPMGTVVPVSADAPSAEFEFDQWTGDTAHLADPAAPSTTFTMPNADSAITATYKLKTYNVTFSLGDHGTRTGGGELQQTVEHGSSAEEPTVSVAEGWHFVGWDTDITNVTGSLEVQAICAAYHSITIEGGTGPSKAYTGQQVAVSADAPLEGRSFSRWMGNISGLENAESADTTLTMPDADVSLQAVYAFEMPLQAGWNAVALPFEPLDGQIAQALTSEARAETIGFTAWIWDGQHFQTTLSLVSFQGTWIRLAESARLIFESDEQDTPEMTLNPGWQFVGPATAQDVPASRGNQVRAWACPDGKAFKPVDRMSPGVACWIWH